jgi:hypothetical protein
MGSAAAFIKQLELRVKCLFCQLDNPGQGLSCHRCERRSRTAQEFLAAPRGRQWSPDGLPMEKIARSEGLRCRSIFAI